MTRGAIGVFGGTFNPIHVGHLRAAEEVREQLELAEVLFVPSATPPHKGDSKGEIAPAEDRAHWVELAIADHPSFRMSRVELERAGPSYTVDTLEELGREGGAPATFLIGHDAFRELGTWHRPERLLEIANLVVLARPPLREASLVDWMPRALARAFHFSEDGASAEHVREKTWLRALRISGFEVSATELRQRLRTGRSTRYLIPEPARQAILEGGFFRTDGGTI